MDVPSSMLDKFPPEMVVAVCVVFSLLFFLGLGADVFLVIHFVTHPPSVAQWTRRLRARPWTWREFILVTLPLVILHVVLAAFLYESFGGEMPEPPVLLRAMVLTTLALQGPAVLLVAYVLVRKRLTLTRAFGARLKTLPVDAAKGALSYLAVFLPIGIVGFVYMQLLQALGCNTEAQDVIQLLQKAESPAAIAVLGFIAVVAAPIVEEVVFRGIMLPFLAKHMSVGSAVLLVSFLFAVIHFHIPAFVPLFLLAIGLSLSYIATGSLAVPIVTHACFNAISLTAALVLKDVAI